jgi:hypothetical protein
VRALSKADSSPEDLDAPHKVSQHLSFQVDRHGRLASLRVRRLLRVDHDGTTSCQRLLPTYALIESGRLAQQWRQVGSGNQLLWFGAATEQSRTGLATEDSSVVPYRQPRIFPQTKNSDVVLLMELGQSLVPRLAHVPALWIRVDVVRVDLERHQPQRFERGRVHDRHVVARSQCWTRHVRARTGSQVGKALVDQRTQRLDQPPLVQRLEQPERIPSADEHGLRLLYRQGGAVCDMETVHRDTEWLERLGHGCRVVVVRRLGEWHEQQGTPPAEPSPGPRRERVPERSLRSS